MRVEAKRVIPGRGLAAAGVAVAATELPSCVEASEFG